jgi:hypothetical protein
MCAVPSVPGAARSGRLCHGDGGGEGGDRLPEGVDVAILYHLTQPETDVTPRETTVSQ